ncbi:MAG: hypothetical protein AB8G05_18485 [Oligoflexales bacterium]
MQRQEFSFRPDTTYGATDTDEYTLENFLDLPEKTQALKVENIDFMLKEDPSDFLRVLVNMFPFQTGNIEGVFELFYKETFQIDKLIVSLPSFQDSHQKLAGILLELIIWCEILPQVEAQVGNLLDLDKNHVRELSRVLFWGQVGNHVGKQVGKYVANEVGNESLFKVLTELKDSLDYQIGKQVWSKLNRDLDYFINELEYCNQTLIKTLKSVFTIYQIGTLTIRHSDEFKEIHSILSHFIFENISDNKVKSILKSIELPKLTEKNHFVDTQIKLIKSYLIF